MQAVEIELPAQARYVGVARRFVRDTLVDWAIDSLTINAEIVASELVTNGLIHARTPLVLRLRHDGERLVVEVSDESPLRPSLRHYSTDATTGRGLSLVDSLTGGEWGSRETGTGKTVWARIRPGEDSVDATPEELLAAFDDELDDLDPGADGGGAAVGRAAPRLRAA